MFDFNAGKTLAEMLDESDHDTAIGICPFGCNKDEDDGLVEFDEQLNFTAERRGNKTELLSCELRYTCFCCYTSFSISSGGEGPLDEEDVIAFQLRLQLTEHRIPSNNVFGDEKIGLIVNYEDEPEADLIIDGATDDDHAHLDADDDEK